MPQTGMAVVAFTGKRLAPDQPVGLSHTLAQGAAATRTLLMMVMAMIPVTPPVVVMPGALMGLERLAGPIALMVPIA